MLRIHLAVIGILSLGTSLGAQSSGRLVLPAPGVKEGGTYHLATGTWTRGATGAAAWNDPIFDNRCRTGTYAPHGTTQRYVDDGRIPSATSPTNPGPPYSAVSWTGLMNAYDVCYFEIGYCTFTPHPSYEINFWDCFSGCADATLLTPKATFPLANLPGSGAGALECWTVGIDLANSSLVFELEADCDGAWWGFPSADHFGWSGQETSPSPLGTPGPLVAGDPAGYLNAGPGSSGCDVGANTIFYAGATNCIEGSGLGSLDMWEEDTVSPTLAYVGCWWFNGYDNGNLFASFHLMIATGCGGCVPPPGFRYCPGDGIAPHTPCPCGNDNNGEMGGCVWDGTLFPTGGILDAVGDSDHTNPDVTLYAIAVPNDFGIFFGANHQVNGGNGNPLNDGLRCAGAGLVRLTPPTMAILNTASHGPIELTDTSSGPGLTRRYQYWFRSPGGPCGTSANLTNGYEISWL